MELSDEHGKYPLCRWCYVTHQNLDTEVVRVDKADGAVLVRNWLLRGTAGGGERVSKGLAVRSTD
jgi:hypothetical protein